MKLNIKLMKMKPCWRRSRRPLYMSWEASESQSGLKSNYQALNPSSHQVLLCWTHRSNAVPCLTSGSQFPEHHKMVDHILLSSSPFLSCSLHPDTAVFPCVTRPLWTLCCSFCVFSWAGTHGRFCSGMFWWTARRTAPHPSWQLRRSEGGGVAQGRGRSRQARP